MFSGDVNELSLWNGKKTSMAQREGRA
jgi:hypothetical protein